MTIRAELVNADRLTPREADVALRMCEGLADKDIARVLAISIKTVQAHTSALYEKLGLRSQSINTRCTAILTLVARGMVVLSLRSVVFVLIFNALWVDDEALRVRSARGRSHSVFRMRRADDV